MSNFLWSIVDTCIGLNAVKEKPTRVKPVFYKVSSIFTLLFMIK